MDEAVPYAALEYCHTRRFLPSFTSNSMSVYELNHRLTDLSTYWIVADLNHKNSVISRGSSHGIRRDLAATRNKGEFRTEDDDALLICRIDIPAQRRITKDSLLKHHGRERILCSPPLFTFFFSPCFLYF